MKPMLAVCAIFAVIAVTGAALPATGDQDQDLEARVAALEKRVKAIENDKAVLESKLAAQGELLQAVYTWFRELPRAGERLNERLENARKWGFLMAGPNPRAKQEVLDGLEEFLTRIVSANPAKPTRKQGQPR